MEESLESLVKKATDGNQDALEEVVKSIQDRIYGLALRMLWHPSDAEDATQEILIKVITNLNSFRAESAFTTWVYRIASNHLITTRKRRAGHEDVTFDKVAEHLDHGLSDEPIQVADEIEHKLLIDEVRIGCTHGMLLCLDRGHRMAFILGEIAELDSQEGSYILEITPATFRKRLSRARKRVLQFMQRKCGIVNPNNPCRCSKRIDTAVNLGYVDPKNLLFAHADANTEEVADLTTRIGKLRELNRVGAVYRSTPKYAASTATLDRLREMINSGALDVSN